MISRQAVILVAGRGKRLGALTESKPKCLLEVGGRSLLAWQLEMLRKAGVSEIALVLGHGASQVRAVAGSDCHYIMNARHIETNSLYSAWLAREWIRSGFILLNGDVLASPAIFRIVARAASSTLCYDSTSGREAEHMKVQIRSGALAAIGKELAPDKIDGENVGLLYLDEQAASLFFSVAERRMRERGMTEWAPVALNEMASEVKIQCSDVAGMPWIEIDFSDDLKAAELKVMPQLLAHG